MVDELTARAPWPDGPEQAPAVAGDRRDDTGDNADNADAGHAVAGACCLYFAQIRLKLARCVALLRHAANCLSSFAVWSFWDF